METETNENKIKFKGLRVDKKTDKLIEYVLELDRREISCYYQDRYGSYVCTTFGRMYKVKHHINELRRM